MKTILVTLMLYASSTFAARLGDLVYCLEGDPTGFNPAVTNTLTGEKMVHQNLFNQLVEFGKTAKTSDLRPGLASKWEIKENGLVYEFELRQDAVFHPFPNAVPTEPGTLAITRPSRTLNADDVLFTFDRYMNPSNPLHKTNINKGGFPYWKNLKMPDLIEKVEKIDNDDYRLRIRLKRPYAAFLMALATPYLSIQSAEYAQHVLKLGNPDLYDLYPVGTGPYRLAWFSSTRDQALFEAMPGQAKVARMEIKVMPKVVERSRGIADGVCDIVADPSIQEYTNLQQFHANQIEFIQADAMNLGYLAINIQKFKDKRVRQAVSLALNRKKYIAKIFLGHAVPARSILYDALMPKGHRTPNLVYAPKRARQLLQQANAVGLEFELWHMPISRPYNVNPEQLGEMMKEDLEAVGFKVKLATNYKRDEKGAIVYDDKGKPVYDFPGFISALGKKEYDISQVGLNSVMPAAVDLYSIIAKDAILPFGNNWTGWFDPKVDRMLEEMRATENPVILARLYEKVEAILGEEMPVVPVLNGKIFRMVRKGVKGYHLHPLHTERFQDLSL